MDRIDCRTVWISDTHLGSRGAQAALLASFLKQITCQKLYLVGDIVDFWRLRSRTHWPASHNEVIRRILKMAKTGTRIVLVPGNHDDVLRQYVDHNFGGIELLRSDVHECVDGRRLLVVHGDEFDLVVTHSRLLSMVGSAAYEWLLHVNRLYNRYRTFRGKPYWSLSQYVKLKVKSACTYVSRFEEALIQEAQRREVDGVVCGHIHKPAIEEMGGVRYLNCGDWVENCTALIERHDGAIELIEARESVAPAAPEPIRSRGRGFAVTPRPRRRGGQTPVLDLTIREKETTVS